MPEGPWPLDGPDEADWELHGTGAQTGGDDLEPALVPDPHFPGGVHPDVAAYGAGAGGVALIGLVTLIKRRRARRRLEELDD